MCATEFRGAAIHEIVNGCVYDGAEAPMLTYHHDPLSSVVSLTGHTGSVEEDIHYGPFGQVFATTGSTDNLLRYTGRDVDPDTGLYYYRARYYDPALGRFLSEDPLGFGSGDVNFYAYVTNNPVVQNDPTGQCPTCLAGAFIGAAAGGFSAAFSPDATYGDVLAGAAVGAATGAVVGSGAGAVAAGLSYVGVGATTAAASGAVVAGGAAGGAGSATAQALTSEQINLTLVGVSTVGGAVAGAIPAAAAAGVASGSFEMTTGGAIALDLAGSQAAIGIDLLANTIGSALPAANVDDFLLPGIDINEQGSLSNPVLPGYSGSAPSYPSSPSLDWELDPYFK